MEQTSQIVAVSCTVCVIHVLQILMGCPSDISDVPTLILSIAQSIVTLTILKLTSGLSNTIHKVIKVKKLPSLTTGIANHWNVILVTVLCSTVLWYNEKTVLRNDIIIFLLAHFVLELPGMQKRTINYGQGMACSYYSGYLGHILPPDGYSFDGIQSSIKHFEQAEKVAVPVRRMFIIITKTLHCPPDLQFFNKENRPDLPRLEAAKNIEAVCKDVAGVKNRVYRCSTYQLRRPRAPPLYLLAEGATPLHTLHHALNIKAVAKELANADFDDIKNDFCSTLESILKSSPDCDGKCVLVHFDDTDKSLNLADVLLEEIEKIEPNFENITREHE